MKINQKILSIPPYISTSWKNIAALHVEYEDGILVLIVTLLSGVKISVPNLQASLIETIFNCHARAIEMEEKQSNQKTKSIFPLLPGMSGFGPGQLFSFELPLKLDALPGVDNLNSVLQHNPEQSDTPDLPTEILSKIAKLSATIGITDHNNIPTAEPHCNCIHCQIARALQKGINHRKEEEVDSEEVVSDEDLRFRTWNIAQTGDKVFVVTNPLNTEENYNVYLGDPVGCTCGEKHCEHIRAVLSS